MLDSLVRVTRRVGRLLLVTIAVPRVFLHMGLGPLAGTTVHSLSCHTSGSISRKHKPHLPCASQTRAHLGLERLHIAPHITRAPCLPPRPSDFFLPSPTLPTRRPECIGRHAFPRLRDFLPARLSRQCPEYPPAKLTALPTDLTPTALQRSPSAYPINGFTSSFDPLSKVLFIFPSRYLFAIGLVSLFSLGWCLPPLGAAFPNNPTPQDALYLPPRSTPCQGTLTLSSGSFQSTQQGPRAAPIASKLQFTLLADQAIPSPGSSLFVRHY